MPKYQVSALLTAEAWVNIEAENEAEARQIVSEMSGVDFDSDGVINGGDCWVGDVIELREGN
jgi:hypothetical protein